MNIQDPRSKQIYKLGSYESKQILKQYIYCYKNNKHLFKSIQNGGSQSCKLSLVYMAKPIYGGWVSFTAHLSQQYNIPIYKISNRTESKKRNFGYGVEYQNLSIDDIRKLNNILITAIDKNYYEYLTQLPKTSSIVIHDPTEVKGASCQPVLDILPIFKIYTIRKTVQTYLKKQFGIKSTFRLHPFYMFPKQLQSKKHKIVSISRIDYDKHTEILIEANKLIESSNKSLKRKKHPLIDIYGAKNDRYVYHKLQQHDSMKENDPKSSYKGKFDKTFTAIDTILHNAKFVVDMSAINHDGGGSQYTFLEAIYYDCALILNKQWLESSKSLFIPGVNCFAVSNAEELAKLIISNPNTSSIVQKAKKLLKPHTLVNWCF